MNKLRLFTLKFILLTVVSMYAAFNKTTYYSNANNTSGSTLKTRMYNIVSANTNMPSYSEVWTAYVTTDVRSDGYIWDRYCKTNMVYGPVTNGGNQDNGSGGTAEGERYNREHSFPKSWMGISGSPSKGPGTDLHHVVATDKYANNTRSAHIYGEVKTVTTSFSNSKYGKGGYGSYQSYDVFEPADEYKGDFARIYFYMVTMYQNSIASWYSNNSSTEVTKVLDGSTYPAFQTWYLQMLLAWAESDPVDSREAARNDAVYAVQNNRNPFIDFPGLEQYIWGSYSTSYSAYQTTALSVSNYVDPYSGGNINMPSISVSPAMASIAEGSTTSLTATVSNANGATVTWTTSNGDVAALNATTGNNVTVIGAGAGTATITASITVDGNTYSATCIVIVTSTGGGSGDYYAKVISAPSDWSGTYLIVCESANVALDGGLTSLDVESNTISVSPSNNQIAITSATEAAEFTIASKSGGYSLKSKSGYYIGHSGSSNALRSSSSDDFTNTISLSSGDVTITCNGKNLRYNSTSGQTRFRYFGSAQTAIQLYKKVTSPSGPVAPSVSFASQSLNLTVGDTYTQSVTTNSDGEVTYSISPTSVATIDSSTGEVTAVGEGTATVTANVAATSSYNAGSAQYTITVSRKTPTIMFATSSANIMVGDTYTQTATYDGDGTVSYTSSNPLVATVNTSTGEVTAVGEGTATITATSTQTTAYNSATATYQITVESSSSSSGDYYAKVTSAADLTTGQYLIVYEGGNLAFNGGLSTLDAVGNTISVIPSNNQIELTSDAEAAEFTIDISVGTIKSKSGYYIGQPSDANGLQSSTTNAYTNTITYNDGNIDIKSSGGAYLRYNTSTSNGTRFRYYKSSSYASQKAIQLYKKISGGTTPTGPVDPSVYFATSSVNLTVGGTYTQTVNTNSDGAVTYSVSPTSVATINSSTGQVTAVSAGTATVTATVAATSSYNAGTAQYTVTVSATSVQTTGCGTQDDPYTVADVLLLFADNAVPSQAVYVSGIVSRITSLNPPQYNTARYYISDDGSTDNDFYVYNGKYLNGASFTSTDQLQVGDEVVVYGTLTTYTNGSTSTNEFAGGNYIVTLNRTVVAVNPTVSFAESSVTLIAGDTYKQTVITNSDGAVSYSSSDTSVATVDSSTGVVTAVAEGTCTITATTASTSAYNEGSASYTVTVEAAPTAPYYVKVNTNDEFEEGRQYLIVCEDYNKAMDGSLANLDASVNSIDVSISDNKIPVTPTTTAAEFTVTHVVTEYNTCYSLKSKSGYYIGVGTSSNYGVLSTSTTNAYPNTVNVSGSGYASVCCNYTSQDGWTTAYYLCCGASDQRFRYFRYTQNTRGVQLYKRVDVTVPGDINQDGAVDTLDVEALVQILLGNDSEEYNHDAVDVNRDTMVSIADLTALVNLLNELAE